jgi:cyclic beta-1,2-glucan synthetase
MGTGDWNDGMNLVGADGKGESVWLAWFLVDVLRGMSEMSEALGLADLGREYLEKRDALIVRIERSAWDGEWYLRAIFDDGTPARILNECRGADRLPAPVLGFP